MKHFLYYMQAIVEVCSILNLIYSGLFQLTTHVQDIIFNPVFLKIAFFTGSFLNVRVSVSWRVHFH